MKSIIHFILFSLAVIIFFWWSSYTYANWYGSHSENLNDSSCTPDTQADSILPTSPVSYFPGTYGMEFQVQARVITNGPGSGPGIRTCQYWDATIPTMSATLAYTGLSSWTMTGFTGPTAIDLTYSDLGWSNFTNIFYRRYIWDNPTGCSTSGTTYIVGAKISQTAEWDHKLYLCAQDWATNTWSWIGEYKIDKTKPIVTDLHYGPQNSASGGWQNKTAITITATSYDPLGGTPAGSWGIKNYDIEVRAIFWARNNPSMASVPVFTGTTTTLPYTYYGSGWYAYIVQVRARDNAGNLSLWTTSTDVARIDLLAPEPQYLTTSSVPSMLATGSQAFNFTFNDTSLPQQWAPVNIKFRFENNIDPLIFDTRETKVWWVNVYIDTFSYTGDTSRVDNDRYNWWRNRTIKIDEICDQAWNCNKRPNLLAITCENITNFACTWSVPSSNVSTSNTNWLSADAPWQNTNPGNPCYWNCTGGYTGPTCSIPPSSCAATPTFTNIGTTTIGTPYTAWQAWVNAGTATGCTYTCATGWTGSTCATSAYSCATPVPSYPNILTNTWSPISAWQAWTYTGTAWVGNCTYSCTTGWTGSTCATSAYSCAATPTFPNIWLTNTWSPISAWQAWTYTGTAWVGNCTYTCVGGWTGSGCLTGATSCSLANAWVAVWSGNCTPFTCTAPWQVGPTCWGLDSASNPVCSTWATDIGHGTGPGGSTWSRFGSASDNPLCTFGIPTYADKSTSYDCKCPVTWSSCGTTPTCVWSTCTITSTQPAYEINQAYRKWAVSCGFSCTGGYSGDNCEISVSCGTASGATFGSTGAIATSWLTLCTDLTTPTITSLASQFIWSCGGSATCSAYKSEAAFCAPVDIAGGILIINNVGATSSGQGWIYDPTLSAPCSFYCNASMGSIWNPISTQCERSYRARWCYLSSDSNGFVWWYFDDWAPLSVPYDGSPLTCNHHVDNVDYPEWTILSNYLATDWFTYTIRCDAQDATIVDVNQPLPDSYCPPQTPTCTDSVQNGSETWVDCGGSCPACSAACKDSSFVESSNDICQGYAWGNATLISVWPNGYGNSPREWWQTNDLSQWSVVLSCVMSNITIDVKYKTNTQMNAVPECVIVPTCTDSVQNGSETWVDCGGSCPNACPVLSGDCGVLYYTKPSWPTNDLDIPPGTSHVFGANIGFQAIGSNLIQDWQKLTCPAETFSCAPIDTAGGILLINNVGATSSGQTWVYNANRSVPCSFSCNADMGSIWNSTNLQCEQAWRWRWCYVNVWKLVSWLLLPLPRYYDNWFLSSTPYGSVVNPRCQSEGVEYSPWDTKVWYIATDGNTYNIRCDTLVATNASEINNPIPDSYCPPVTTVLTCGTANGSTTYATAASIPTNILCSDGITIPNPIDDSTSQIIWSCGWTPCSATKYVAPTCSDGILNQWELAIDCGGPNCWACTCSASCWTLNIWESCIDLAAWLAFGRCKTNVQPNDQWDIQVTCQPDWTLTECAKICSTNSEFDIWDAGWLIQNCRISSSAPTPFTNCNAVPGVVWWSIVYEDSEVATCRTSSSEWVMNHGICRLQYAVCKNDVSNLVEGYNCTGDTSQVLREIGGNILAYPNCN